MALALTVTKHWMSGPMIEVIGTIVASGNYVTNGDTLSVANTAIKSSKVPLLVRIEGVAGYKYEFVPGSSQTNGKLIVRECAAAGNPMAQIPQAAYPGGVTGDTIKFYALFQKLV